MSDKSLTAGLLSEFVGRSKELNYISSSLYRSDSPPLTNFHGISGIGKSFLLNRIAVELNSRNVTTASIDLARGGYMDPFDIMTRIREQLHSERFEDFDFLMTRYREMVLRMLTPHVVINARGLSVNLSNVNFQGQVGDVSALKVSDITLVIPPAELYRVKQECIADATRSCIGALRAIAKHRLLVLLLDEYDAVGRDILSQETEAARWIRVDFAGELFATSHSQIRLIVASQRPLSWSSSDRRWSAVLKHYELQGLQSDEVRQYCQNRGIPAATAAEIEALTKGHPRYVCLACDFASNYIGPTGAPSSGPIWAAVGSAAVRELDEPLLVGILKNLPADLTQTLLLVSSAKSVNEKVLATISPGRDWEDGRRTLEHLAALSFVKKMGDSAYVIDNVVRHLLQRRFYRTDKEPFRASHVALSSLREESSGDGNRREQSDEILHSLYHQLMVDPAAAIDGAIGAIEFAIAGCDVTYCRRLHAVALEVEQIIGQSGELTSALLLSDAVALQIEGSWPLAEEKYSEVLQMPNSPERIWNVAARQVGTLYGMTGRAEEGIRWLERAVARCKERQDVPLLIRTLNDLGSAYRTQIRLEDALTLYQESEELAKGTGSVHFNQDIAISRLYSGVILTGLGRYGEAEKAYIESLGLFEAMHNLVGCARVHQRIGWLLRIRGDLETSRKHQREALNIFEQIGLRFPIAESQHSLATVERLLENWNDAACLYGAALSTFVTMKADRHVGIVQNDMGSLLLEKGQARGSRRLMRKALRLFTESLDCKRRLGNQKETSVPLSCLGEACTALGRWAEAISFFKEAASVARETGVRINEARAIVGLLRVQHLQRSYLQFVELVERAVSIAVADGYNHYAAIAYLYYGAYLLQGEETSRAIPEFARALHFASLFNSKLLAKVCSGIIRAIEYLPSSQQSKISSQIEHANREMFGVRLDNGALISFNVALDRTRRIARFLGYPLSLEHHVPGCADTICVVGGRIASNGKPSDGLLRRVSHGVELMKMGCAPRLILSGGRRQHGRVECEVMRDAALECGAPFESLILECKSVNTQENAEYVTCLMMKCGYKSTILVTSPYHMKRVLWLFRRSGTKAEYSIAFWPHVYTTKQELSALLHEYGAWAWLVMSGAFRRGRRTRVDEIGC